LSYGRACVVGGWAVHPAQPFFKLAEKMRSTSLPSRL